MTVHLLFPPHWFPAAPYASLPLLAGALGDARVSCVQHDLALQGFEDLVSRYALCGAADDGALGLAFLLTRQRPNDALEVMRSDAYFDSAALQSAQATVDWWIRSIAARFPHLEFDRFVCRRQNGCGGPDERSNEHPYSSFIADWVDDFEPAPGDTAAISLTTEHQLLAATDLGSRLRERHSQLRIALGGAWLSRMPLARARTIAHAIGAHALVVGDGSQAIVELATDNTWGPGAPMRVERRTRPAPCFPTPRFDADCLHRYLLPRPVLPIWNAKGCYYGRCHFCDEPATFEGRKRFTAVRALADQIIAVASRHPGCCIQLNAECDTPQRLAGLARILKIEAPGVVWSSRARIEPAFRDPGILEALRAGGCALLVFGLESLEDSVLEAMRKGYDGETARQVLAAVGRSGIWRSVFLIAGYPQAGPSSTLQTVLSLAGPPRLADSIQCSIFRVPEMAPIAAAKNVVGVDVATGQRLADPIRRDHPWAFRGATREGLLVALATVDRDKLRGGLDGYLR